MTGRLSGPVGGDALVLQVRATPRTSPGMGSSSGSGGLECFDGSHHVRRGDACAGDELGPAVASSRDEGDRPAVSRRRSALPRCPAPSPRPPPACPHHRAGRSAHPRSRRSWRPPVQPLARELEQHEVHRSVDVSRCRAHESSCRVRAWVLRRRRAPTPRAWGRSPPVTSPFRGWWRASTRRRCVRLAHGTSPLEGESAPRLPGVQPISSAVEPQRWNLTGRDWFRRLCTAHAELNMQPPRVTPGR